MDLLPLLLEDRDLDNIQVCTVEDLPTTRENGDPLVDNVDIVRHVWNHTITQYVRYLGMWAPAWTAVLPFVATATSTLPAITQAATGGTADNTGTATSTLPTITQSATGTFV